MHAGILSLNLENAYCKIVFVDSQENNLRVENRKYLVLAPLNRITGAS